MRLILFVLLGFIFFENGYCQNFDPKPSAQQEKIEKFLNNTGSIERVYLSDVSNNVFEAKPGGEYFTAFIFNRQQKSSRRLRIFELGENGETVSIKYSKVTKAVSDDDYQIFAIRVSPDAAKSTVTRYKIEASPEATVLIYKVMVANTK